MSEPTLLIAGGSRRLRGGRPPRAGVRATERVEFRMTEDERKALAAAARENGMRVAALVREAVNELVADYSDRRVFKR